MDVKDLIITPLTLLVLYVVAWIIRPYFTDELNRKYFLPALSVKFLGAIAVGVVYQFYYNGGDTFNFHTHGSIHIWQALMDDPLNGLKLLMDNGRDQYSVWEYTSRIWYYGDKASYSVVKLAAIFDVFTFATYSATASMFAFMSFTGVWMLYLTFYRLYPGLHRNFAIAILFMPSVFFWGSSIFKDTVVLAAMGWMVFSFYKLVIERKKSLLFGLIFLFSAYVIYVIKIYVIMTLLPALMIWLVFVMLKGIRMTILRVVIFPVLILFGGLGAYLVADKISEGHSRYSLENIGKTARITSYDIRYGWGARMGEGSGYDLGELDGSFGSMVRLAPAGVNVALFRPYMWEVKNPLMLLSAFESLFLLGISLYGLFFWVRNGNLMLLLKPEVLMALSFSIVFAFAIGVSTFNFGTLARYKLPLIPMYLSAVMIMTHIAKKTSGR